MKMDTTIEFGGPTDASPLTASVRSELGMGQHYTDRDHPVVRRAVELAVSLESPRILELGSGRGLVAMALVDESRATVTATEINQEGLDVLGQGIDGQQGIDIRIFDASQPIPDDLREVYDMVVAKDVLPFIPPEGVRMFLRNISDALKPNGLTLLTGPLVDTRLFNEAAPFSNPNGNFSRLLSPEAQIFVQTTVPSLNFVSPDFLERELEIAGLTMTAHEAFGRENGWLMAIAAKVEFPGEA